MEITYKWLSMRHFITSEYQNDIYMGRQQYPINNTDIITHGLIESLGKCVLFASPLKRSIQTVDFIIETYKAIDFDVRYLDALVERGLGDFEGKQKAPLKKNTEYFYEGNFIVTKTPPNGESLSDFRNRVKPAVEAMLTENKNNNILVVSHLQTFRMINFCVESKYDYDEWYNIKYNHGEVAQEEYGKR
jgi:broad specificity phosphatase PhoE